MKQHITVQDLNQLSKTGKKRLRNWCKGKGYGKNELVEWENGEKTFLPFDILSIGQMIEFLDEEDDYFKTWYRQGNSKVSKTNKTISWEYNEELCDDLWQEVTKVLERN